MAATPNAFPLGTLRCKKLRRGRERGRGENVGWAPRKFCCRWKKEFLIRWHRNYPSLLKSSSVSLRFLRCISTVFRTPSMSRVRVSQCVYTEGRQTAGSRCSCASSRRWKKKFRWQRSWTKVDRANRDLLSRVGFEFAVNRKTSVSTTYKTRALHTRAVFRRSPATLSVLQTCLTKFQHAEEFLSDLPGILPTSVLISFARYFTRYD